VADCPSAQGDSPCSSIFNKQ
ncbi:hypothetical protein EC950183_1742, partial [Escherichia coli 95.0183]